MDFGAELDASLESIRELLSILSKLLKPPSSPPLANAITPSDKRSHAEFSFDDFDDVLPAATQTSMDDDAEESDGPSVLLAALNSHILLVNDFVQKVDEHYLASIGNVPLAAQGMLTHDIYSFEDGITILEGIKQRLLASLNKNTPPL